MITDNCALLLSRDHRTLSAHTSTYDPQPSTSFAREYAVAPRSAYRWRKAVCHAADVFVVSRPPPLLLSSSRSKIALAQSPLQEFSTPSRAWQPCSCVRCASSQQGGIHMYSSSSVLGSHRVSPIRARLYGRTRRGTRRAPVPVLAWA